MSSWFDFGCDLHHFSSPTRWNGSGGQVRPETVQKPNTWLPSGWFFFQFPIRVSTFFGFSSVRVLGPVPHPGFPKQQFSKNVGLVFGGYGAGLVGPIPGDFGGPGGSRTGIQKNISNCCQRAAAYTKRCIRHERDGSSARTSMRAHDGPKGRRLGSITRYSGVSVWILGSMPYRCRVTAMSGCFLRDRKKMIWATLGPACGPKPSANGEKTGPKLPGPSAGAVWDRFLFHSL